ncbi:MAG: adenylate/guanylate cyclase domain-containing protein [Phycisphaerales bacterium]
MSDPSNCCVVAFAGHLLDRPDRPTPRFPESSEQVVAEAIARQLDIWGATEGVCSLARGSDILFAEAMLKRGGRLRIVLPMVEREFLQEQDGATWDDRWKARYWDVRRQTSEPEIFGGKYLEGSGTSFLAVTRLMDGLAEMQARERGLAARSLAVWDGERGHGLGGTTSFVGHAVLMGREIVCLDPMTGAASVPGAEAIRAAASHRWKQVVRGNLLLEHRLVAALFADIKGFSRLDEPQVPAFMHEVSGAIKQAVVNSGAIPRIINTWGDGIFAVTEDIESAGLLALGFREQIAGIDPSKVGATERFSLRVGLHAGPAFVGFDPVLGRQNAYGVDISRTARIEPIVDADQVWCSLAFAALAESENVKSMRFSPLGVKELHKNAGPMTMFRVDGAEPRRS